MDERKLKMSKKERQRQSCYFHRSGELILLKMHPLHTKQFTNLIQSLLKIALKISVAFFTKIEKNPKINMEVQNTLSRQNKLDGWMDGCKQGRKEGR